MRHTSVTDYAIAAVENRFDALYIMDVEEKDQTDKFITGSLDLQRPSVQYTINEFANRNLDTSFAAAYYPDVVMQDPATRTNVVVSPSVAVLGAFALNDTVAHPWFAPAGFSRGALPRVLETQVKLNRSNLDDLYEVDINPLTSFADTNGVVVFGQKTLLASQSALDRVNVRRLLIEVRRRVRRIANTFIFEPNRESTLARFSAAVNPALQQIQAQRGLDRYKVQIDTTTTTQADVENNTIRGKVYLQPTRSLEFISLDFVVTNQGAAV
jgi:phage tail sheath protein FI